MKIKKIGKVIRYKRKSLGIRQDDLANEIGISTYYLNLIENGTAVNPRIQVFIMLCLLLDLNIHDFVEPDSVVRENIFEEAD